MTNHGEALWPVLADPAARPPRQAAARLVADPLPRAALHRSPSEFGLDIEQALRLIRRRWRLAASIAVVGTVVAVALIALLPPTYRAEAVLVLDPRRSKIGELQSPVEGILSRTQADLSAMRTETDLVTSPTVLREVVTRLRLTEAAPASFDPGAALAGLRLWLGLPPPGETSASTLEIAGEQRVDRAVEELAGGQVRVANEGGSYTLRVQADAVDPVLAARLANTVAEVYLEQQRARQQSEREAESAWLRDRLEGLRHTVRESDAAVEAYRTRNRLAQGSAASTLEGRISEVNSAVSQARTRLSRQSASLAEATRSLRRDDGQSAPAVLASALVQGLSVQEATLQARRSELQQAVGPRHPAILDIDAQLAGLHARIGAETDRIVAGLQAEVTATRNEIQDLVGQLDDLEDQRESAAGAMVELAELERRAAANREVYGQALTQFSASLVRQAANPGEMRLVAAAHPPLEPVKPKRRLLAVGAGLASGALGALVALAVGFRRGGFGGATPLEALTGLPTLELVPELTRRELRRLRRHGGTAGTDLRALRSLAFVLHRVCEATPARPTLLLVTSAMRGEGKSFCANHLARMLASLGRRRVLLVDLDFWRPRAARTVGEPLPDSAGWAIDGTAVLHDPAAGLDVLPVDEAALADGREAGFARRLAALRAQRSAHDLMVLDAPAVFAIPDVLAAATAADATLLVVQFERTSAGAVRSALVRLGSVGVRPLGTVLNRVVVRHYRRYGYREA